MSPNNVTKNLLSANPSRLKRGKLEYVKSPIINSRNRLLKTLRGEKVDRVPVTLFIVHQGHFMTQVYPDIDPCDCETLEMKVIEVQKQLGVDVFVRQLFGFESPLGMHMGGINFSTQTENWEVCTEENRDKETLKRKCTIKTPDGILTQELSMSEPRLGTQFWAITKPAISCSADLDIAIKYEPRMSESWKNQITERIKKLKRALGNDGILGFWSPPGPFNICSTLIAQNELYALFLTDYNFYEKMMNFAIERSLDYLGVIEDAGIDVHCIAGNAPGGFLGKKFYDRYVLPFEKKYIDFVQQKGTPAMYHNCGKIMNLVDSYKYLGAKIIEPFAPSPLGNADLAKVKNAVNGDYVILSGIDQVNVLKNGTVDQVKRTTEEVMKIGKIGGKFIMQPVDFLEYGTPLENINAYVETAMANSSYY